MWRLAICFLHSSMNVGPDSSCLLFPLFGVPYVSSLHFCLSLLCKELHLYHFSRVHTDVLLMLFVFLFVTYWVFKSHLYRTSQVLRAHIGPAQVNRFEPLFPHRQCEEGELF